MKRIMILLVGVLALLVNHQRGYSQQYEYCSQVYPAHNLEWSSTENWLAVGYGASIYIYDPQLDLLHYLSIGSISDSYEAYVYEPIAVLWEPGTTKLLSLPAGLRVVLWDVSQDMYERPFGFDQAALGADWHPEGQYLAVVVQGGEVVSEDYSNAVRILDLETRFWTDNPIHGQKLDNKVGYILEVAWHPEGEILALGEEQGTLSFWNPLSEEHLQSVTIGEGDFTVLEWNANGTSLAIGMDDGTAGIWNYEEHIFQSLADGTSEHFVTGLAWNEDATVLAIAFSDGEVNLFSLESGQVIHTITVESSNTISLAWKGSLLAIFSCTGSVEIWNTETYERTAYIELESASK